MINRSYRVLGRSGEVVKRRERGRVVRSAWVPLALVLGTRDGWGGAIVGSLLLVTIVYGLAEVALFQEAKLVVEASEHDCERWFE
jgi:hypothetical protein